MAGCGCVLLQLSVGGARYALPEYGLAAGLINLRKRKMNRELIESALHAADMLLGVVIHSGAYLQTTEGIADAKAARDLVKDALLALKKDAQTQ